MDPITGLIWQIIMFVMAIIILVVVIAGKHYLYSKKHQIVVCIFALLLTTGNLILFFIDHNLMNILTVGVLFGIALIKIRHMHVLGEICMVRRG